MEGFIRIKESKGKLLTKYVSVWAVLDNQQLSYFEKFDQRLQKPVGFIRTINIVSTTVVEKIATLKRKFTIGVTPAGQKTITALDCLDSSAQTAWFDALERAKVSTEVAVEAAEKPSKLMAILGIQLQPGEKLTRNDITKAYRKLCLKVHPDKGGDVDTFNNIYDAYNELIMMHEDNEQEENTKVIDYEVIIKKEGPGIGLGLNVIFNKQKRHVHVKKVNPKINILGMSEEAENGEILPGDVFLAIDGEDCSTWEMSRMTARLSASRVPVGDTITFTLERRLPKTEDDNEDDTPFSTTPTRKSPFVAPYPEPSQESYTPSPPPSESQYSDKDSYNRQPSYGAQPYYQAQHVHQYAHSDYSNDDAAMSYDSANDSEFEEGVHHQHNKHHHPHYYQGHPHFNIPIPPIIEASESPGSVNETGSVNGSEYAPPTPPFSIDEEVLEFNINPSSGNDAKQVLMTKSASPLIGPRDDEVPPSPMVDQTEPEQQNSMFSFNYSKEVVLPHASPTTRQSSSEYGVPRSPMVDQLDTNFAHASPFVDPLTIPSVVLPPTSPGGTKRGTPANRFQTSSVNHLVSDFGASHSSGGEPNVVSILGPNKRGTSTTINSNRQMHNSTSFPSSLSSSSVELPNDASNARYNSAAPSANIIGQFNMRSSSVAADQADHQFVPAVQFQSSLAANTLSVPSVSLHASTSNKRSGSLPPPVEFNNLSVPTTAPVLATQPLSAPRNTVALPSSSPGAKVTTYVESTNFPVLRSSTTPLQPNHGLQGSPGSELRNQTTPSSLSSPGGGVKVSSSWTQELKAVKKSEERWKQWGNDTQMKLRQMQSEYRTAEQQMKNMFLEHEQLRVENEELSRNNEHLTMLLAEKVSHTPGNSGRSLLVAQEEWASVHRAKRDTALLALSNRYTLDRIRTEDKSSMNIPSPPAALHHHSSPSAIQHIPDITGPTTTAEEKAAGLAPPAPSSPLGCPSTSMSFNVTPKRHTATHYDTVVQQSEEGESSLREWMVNMSKTPENQLSQTTPSRVSATR